MRTTVVCTDNNQMIGIISKYSQYPIFIYIYILFFFIKININFLFGNLFRQALLR